MGSPLIKLIAHLCTIMRNSGLFIKTTNELKKMMYKFCFFTHLYREIKKIIDKFSFLLLHTRFLVRWADPFTFGPIHRSSKKYETWRATSTFRSNRTQKKKDLTCEISIKSQANKREERGREEGMEGLSEIGRVPEDCVSRVLSLTTPRDSCRSAAVSAAFRRAADSDDVWSQFLPSDYHEILSRAVDPPPVFSSLKELYFLLCDSILIDDGRKVNYGVDEQKPTIWLICR